MLSRFAVALQKGVFSPRIDHFPLSRSFTRRLELPHATRLGAETSSRTVSVRRGLVYYLGVNDTLRPVFSKDLNDATSRFR